MATEFKENRKAFAHRIRFLRVSRRTSAIRGGELEEDGEAACAETTQAKAHRPAVISNDSLGQTLVGRENCAEDAVRFITEPGRDESWLP